MKLSNRAWLSRSIVATLAFVAPALAQDPGVKTYPTYRAAAAAFVAAEKAKDDAALKEILGPEAQGLLSSGDATADENSRVSFLKHYEEAHAFVRETPDKVTVTVGPTAWPLPFPIVRANGVWHFDAIEGAKELVYRRIGRNELDAIKVCQALYVAQKTYKATGHDGNPAGLYAQRFRSTPGTEDGLYWEAKDGEAISPAGSLVAEATNEGYDSARQSGKPTPFHGYYYRMLKSQGPHATGGAKEYVVDGKMSGGFAFVVYPAEYGASGVMTFLVGAHGTVYQKDLGQGTEEAAKAMTTYDPDSTWKAVR